MKSILKTEKACISLITSFSSSRQVSFGLRNNVVFGSPNLAKRFYAGRSSTKRASPNSFGSFERIVPKSLSLKKPLPKNPDFNKVPSNVLRPEYSLTGEPSRFIHEIPIIDLQDSELLSKIRNANRLAANTLKYAGSLVTPGITTAEIDSLVHNYIISNNAYPSPLNYYGFPKSICTSINNIVAHGIPDK
ncbi:Methionine aminopeptidase 1D, mitochondrial [Smittium mucronatum]|uniref:Methionine aminopeptidase 1D, mitochondrial n=1 Tax=Smittium mucronatum TaxID=133383 RepID=A0A1R0H0N2_9FUNG|nr:Methionine aminopeptidase 1D, mitochondrial [Smittium mucronatum]